MKNKISVFFFVMLSMGIFCGCGGEYAGRSENAGVSGGAVSASAVSGQAVSDQAASPQAVFGTGKKEKHLYSNDTNVYYVDWESETGSDTLVERNLSTGAEKKMVLKDLGELLFVDNDWIYYYVYEDKADVFYRAPMEKKGDSLHVNLEKEEALFSEEDGVYGMYKADHGPFCNAKWIAYATTDGKLCRYDIGRRESLSPLGDYATMGDQASMDGVVVHLGSGEDYECDWLDGDSGKLVRIPMPEEETYYGARTSVSGVGVFFADSYTYDEEDDPVEKMDLCLWHTPDASHPEGWTEVITKGEEIRSLLKGREDIDEKASLETVSIFVRNDTVYQQISAEWEKGDVTYRNIIVISRNINSDGERPVPKKTLKVEKELSQVLENPKENQKEFLKVWERARPASKAFFFSRGLCHEITEKYALFILSEKEEWRKALYEFESGKLRFVDEKDPEWGLFYQDISWFEPGLNFMPDNGGDVFDLEG